VSEFESTDEDGELDPLDDAPANSIGSDFDAGKFADALMGPQLDLPKIASRFVTAQLDLLDSTKIYRKFAGAQLDLVNTSKIASGIITAQLDLLDLPKIASALVNAQFDSLGGLIELERLLENLSVRHGVVHTVSPLDREQIRQLWGQYIYFQVLLLCFLLVVVVVTSLGTAENDALAIATTTTGVSCRTVASKAQKIAVNNFDKLFPPGRKVPDFINIMI
jgi:hypothetical protein